MGKAIFTSLPVAAADASRSWEALARDTFLSVLEQVRRRYRFDVIGFVIMPEHIHLLISKPEKGNPSVVMQVLKQTVAQRLLRKHGKKTASQTELWRDREEPFWQRRFYDFNVFSDARCVEKLQYMHHNPVKRGLVDRPELWAWSSYRVYAFGEHGRVKMDWLRPPYVFRKPKLEQPIATGDLGRAHPANPAQSAAPTSRERKQKPL